jgi:glycosyltransferase involved in cell wall biosynthesis
MVHSSVSALIRRTGHRFPKVRSLVKTLVDTLSLFLSTRVIAGDAEFDPARKTIILGSHDASNSGAPILAVNIARHLSKRYNVICLMLASGPLSDEFGPYCVSRIVPISGTIRDADPRAVARRILSKVKLQYGADYALANSVECEVLLSAARLLEIPTVALIHEFAEYTHPTRLARTLTAADCTVFSSELLAKSALGDVPRISEEHFILPQGKCSVPRRNLVQGTGGYRAHLQRAINPTELLCIGCGRVEMRKGVDLFIAAAAMALDRGVNARFIWVGDGYKPEHDLAYSIWLKDQIARSGHANSIELIPALSGTELDVLYGDAHLMFLSSRLDPLPNVAIDALYSGVPVICFDRATGFAEYLRSDELLESLVVSYFDLHAATDKIIEIACDERLRSRLSERSTSLAHSMFDLENYVVNLELILEKAEKKQK